MKSYKGGGKRPDFDRTYYMDPPYPDFWTKRKAIQNVANRTFFGALKYESQQMYFDQTACLTSNRFAHHGIINNVLLFLICIK